MKTGNSKDLWGQLFWISSLGIHLVLSTAAGILIGYYLDKWFSTKPVLLIVFFFIGIFAGFRQIFKEVKKSNDPQGKKDTL